MLRQASVATRNEATELPHRVADRPSSNELVDRLLSVSKSTRQFLGIALAEAGLAPGQDQMLLALSAREPVAVHEIAERLSVRPSTISKMADRLSEKGLVQRSAHESDARRVGVSLTEAGLRMRNTVRDVHVRLEREIATGLADDRAAVLLCLARLEKAIAGRLRRLR